MLRNSQEGAPMRMAELSRESRVPVASIKYYLREGLVPPGERTSPNQARYDESHLRRLRVVRALIDVAGMSIAEVRAVVSALDEPEPEMHHVLGVVQQGVTARQAPVDDESRAWALGLIHAVCAERGWHIEDDHVVTESLIAAMCALRDIGRQEPVARLSEYAEIADRVAAVDFDGLAALSTRESQIELAAVGTLLGDTMNAALRRIAQKNASARFFRAGPPVG